MEEGDDQDQNISHIKCQLPNHIIAPISNKIIDMPKTQWTINLHMGSRRSHYPCGNSPCPLLANNGSWWKTFSRPLDLSDGMWKFEALRSGYHKFIKLQLVQWLGLSWYAWSGTWPNWLHLVTSANHGVTADK